VNIRGFNSALVSDGSSAGSSFDSDNDNDNDTTRTPEADCASLCSFEGSYHLEKELHSNSQHQYPKEDDKSFEIDFDVVLGTNDARDEIGVLVKEALIDFESL